MLTGTHNHGQKRMIEMAGSIIHHENVEDKCTIKRKSNGDGNGKENNVDNNQPTLPPTQVSPFLLEMVNSDILTESEKAIFFEYSYDDWNEEDNDMIFSTLKLCKSKFGLGVISTKNIDKDMYIGNFYGVLCRKLPKNPRYSFLVFKGGNNNKALYVDAENEQKRPLLA